MTGYQSVSQSVSLSVCACVCVRAFVCACVPDNARYRYERDTGMTRGRTRLVDVNLVAGGREPVLVIKWWRAVVRVRHLPARSSVRFRRQCPDASAAVMVWADRRRRRPTAGTAASACRRSRAGTRRNARDPSVQSIRPTSNPASATRDI
jgi:hypothetical protein